MDIQQTLLNGGVSGGIVALFYFTYKIFKRSRCSSNCCGYKNDLEVSLGSNSSDNKKPFIV